jgi:hypothetical protein
VHNHLTNVQECSRDVATTISNGSAAPIANNLEKAIIKVKRDGATLTTDRLAPFYAPSIPASVSNFSKKKPLRHAYAKFSKRVKKGLDPQRRVAVALPF